jgi:5-methylthioadenosine/S-adenosylhomocysteine deaminase
LSEVIIRGGTILVVDDDFTIATGDVASRDGRLVQVGGDYTPQEDDFEIIDAADCIVMPGLVQSHVHTCQTLARGYADDLELLDWLQKIVWPYEGQLSAEDAAAAARLANAELLLGGTTTVLDMGTVHHTDALFEVARDSGIRATIGKAMMDENDPAIPAGLRETSRQSLDESTRLCKEWHGRSMGRLRYAFTPRFALSCTDGLLRDAAATARQLGAILHTHTSENRQEIAEVEKRKGAPNVEYLHSVGLTGSDVCLAHCIWLSEREIDILRDSGTHVLHCPSSNLKLASGVASIPELIEAGISVSIGSDGAPCGNNLDGFLEMRLAALIHKPRAGARAMHAALTLRLATLGGARALGLQDEIGSLEVGKKADVIVLSQRAPHTQPGPNPYSSAVYASRSSDVKDVVIDGTIVVRDRELLTVDTEHAIADARQRSRKIFAAL